MHADRISKKLPSRIQLISLYRTYGERARVPILKNFDLLTRNELDASLPVEEISLCQAAIETLARQVAREQAEECVLELAMDKLYHALRYEHERGFKDAVTQAVSDIGGWISLRRRKRIENGDQ